MQFKVATCTDQRKRVVAFFLTGQPASLSPRSRASAVPLPMKPMSRELFCSQATPPLSQAASEGPKGTAHTCTDCRKKSVHQSPAASEAPSGTTLTYIYWSKHSGKGPHRPSPHLHLLKKEPHSQSTGKTTSARPLHHQSQWHQRPTRGTGSTCTNSRKSAPLRHRPHLHQLEKESTPEPIITPNPDE